MRKLMGKAMTIRSRFRRLVLVTNLRVTARLKGTQLRLFVAPDVEIGSRVKIRLYPRTSAHIVIGPGCRLFDDVEILVRGGELVLTERVEIRKGSCINLSGTFHCVGDNIISWQNVIHCSERITLDRYASTNEFVSIIDSTHHHDGENAFFYENVSSAPISIGRNTWICNKSSVLMGVRIGHNCVVASHAVVNKDVPDGMVVGGMPAKVIGPRVVDGPAKDFFEPNEQTVLRLLSPGDEAVETERKFAN